MVKRNEVGIGVARELREGFTLIELLIVIAVLGVLAAVVLVAINPVQQLARTRDIGRVSSVTQIGHAMESYYTSHNGAYPTTLAALVTAGELSTVPSQVTNTLSTYCTGNTQGWCFASDTDSAAVWSNLESSSQKDAAGCTAAQTAVTVYASLSGRTCVICSTPTANTACP
jgi:prepilin-type N-terminal cleavage/methylation domain-containing protein